MPWGDRTGPWGQGPMTGRAAGFCAGFPVPGFLNPGQGLGWGRGRGWRRWAWARPGAFPAQTWGYGVGPGYFAPGYAAPGYDEKQTLRAWSNTLRRQLEAIDKRLAELEGT
ncbi:MAG TPA: DUF5320 domain-containing protein [Firmicutes bacterium]|nr:DUF5320 domain-containing protein [Bacillota bacterium]